MLGNILLGIVSFCTLNKFKSFIVVTECIDPK